MRIRFDNMHGFIRVYDRTRYLILFGAVKYDSTYNSIRYLTGVKSDITYAFSHNYARIKVDSYGFFTSRKNILQRCNTH